MCNIPCISHPTHGAQRIPLPNHNVDVIVSAGHGSPDQRRIHKPGEYRVTTNLMFSILGRDITGERVDRALGSRIRNARITKGVERSY